MFSTGDFPTKKTPEQWRNKFKKMKSAYLKSKAEAGKSGGAPPTLHYFHAMAEFMSHRPCANDVNSEVANIDEEGELT